MRALLRIRAFIRHHDAEAADFSVDDGPEASKRHSILPDPPIEDIVRAHRVLNGNNGETL